MTASEAALPAGCSRRLLPWLVAVAFFMQALDTTILNTAVPGTARALGVAPLSMKAVLSSYTLSLAVFIPISGWMANRFGRSTPVASPQRSAQATDLRKRIRSCDRTPGNNNAARRRRMS